MRRRALPHASTLLALALVAPLHAGDADLIRIPVAGLPAAQRAEVLSGRYDVASRTDGSLDVVADATDQERLTERAVPFDVVIEDLSGFYASRLSAAPKGSTTLGATLVPPFGAGDMGGYYTLAEIESVLDQLAAAYPTLITAKQSIGQSLEGRDIWAVKISDNPGVDEAEPEARFDCLHHAREAQTVNSTLWFMLFLLEEYGSDPLATYLVDEREMWFLLVVNPDGYVYNQQTDPNGGGLWRKNRRDNGGSFGVDLNRNYDYEWGYDDIGSSGFEDSVTYRGPFPASEPETQAMQAFLASRDFQTALTVHSYSDVWLSPWGYDYLLPANNDDYLEVGALANELTGYEHGPAAETLYPANGTTIDYDHALFGTMSWVPEIGGSDDGWWPATDRIVPLAEETLLAFQRTALAAGAFGRIDGIDATDGGDGDGIFEPGELVLLDVNLRNSGRAATTGGLSVALTSAGPWATVTDGSQNVGSLGSFSSTSATAGLALQLDGDVPAGAVVTLSLEIAYDGFVQTSESDFVVGAPARYLHDDVELDFGWIAGLPGDTTSTGVWERANPIGTTYDFTEPASPEDDASPAPGTQCFTTGNGGGDAGTDDVDDGFTTLLTPIFDLSQVAGAEVRYARWFADLNVADDTFEVSISNDGGSNWTSLESVVGNANEWTPVAFRVEDFLTPTDAMQLRFVATDDPNNSVLEAGIDELEIWSYDFTPRLGFYGVPQLGTPVAFQVTGDPGAIYNVYFALDSAQTPIGGVLGDLLIDPLTLEFLYGGLIPAERSEQTVFTVSGGPGLPGTTVHFQALVVAGPDIWLTNSAQTTVLP